MADWEPESAPIQVELEVSDPSQINRLHDRLSRVPGIKVERIPARRGPGQLGVWDVLVVLAGSGSTLAVALRMLPETIRAVRTDMMIRIRSADREIVLTAVNADDVLKLLGVADDE